MRKRFLGLAVAASLAVSMLGIGTASAADATVNVVHGIPGAIVDVCVDGSKAITDFEFGDVVAGVALPKGMHDFKIVAAGDDCTDAAILEAMDVQLKGGKNYTAVAYLMEGGTPTLGLWANPVGAVKKGTARLTVRHTADAPAVDVWANGAVLLEDVPNGASATMKVPNGIYATWVSLPNDYMPVIGPDVLKLRRGNAYQVYAIGDAANYQFVVIRVKVGVK